MIVMAEVIIVGTSHISKQAVRKVKNTIQKEKPDCVAIELCPMRFYSMKIGKKPRRDLRYGLFVYTISLLQELLSKKTGIFPGKEMMTAYEEGKNIGAKVYLIDDSISITVKKIQKIPFYRKISMVFRLFWGSLTEGRFKLSLNKVPSDKDTKKLMSIFKKNAPEFYKILVSDRNKYMAKWIEELSKKYKKIVVVVGIGHKEGLEKLIK